MIDFEHDLRRRLHDAVDDLEPPPGIADRVEARRATRRNPRRAGGVARATVATAAAVALVVGGITVLGHGGTDVQVTDEAERPPTGEPSRWEPVADAPIDPRANPRAVPMGDGRVLVSGSGWLSGVTVTAAVYDPAADAWEEVDPPPADFSPEAAVWADGEVLALAADGRLAAFDPGTGTWAERATNPLLRVRVYDGVMLVWADDELLAIDTGRAPITDEVHAYDPRTDTWRSIARLPEGATLSDAVWTGARVHAVATPADGGGSSVVSLDPGTGEWEDLPAPPLDGGSDRRIGFLVWTGHELVTGGSSVSHWEERAGAVDVAAWNLTSARWRALPDAPVPVDDAHTWSATWTGEEVVAWHDTGGAPGEVAPVVLDPDDGTWTVGPPVVEHRGAPIVPVGSRLFVWSGHSGGKALDRDAQPTPTGLLFTP